jgi:hypothetical protein
LSNQDYNYSTFTLHTGAFEAFADNAPKATMRAPSFPVEDLSTGESIEMGSLWEDGIALLEFGSFTCPYCSINGNEMEDLAVRYAGSNVRSAFIYTREVHPGENCGHHKDMDSKRANAIAFKNAANIKRQILVDDLNGTAQNAYGGLPNMAWIVGRNGFIHYKSAWTSAPDIESALDQIIDFEENYAKNDWVPFYSERTAWGSRDQTLFNSGLEQAGPQAVSDFSNALKLHKPVASPNTSGMRIIPGNFYQPEDK